MLTGLPWVIKADESELSFKQMLLSPGDLTQAHKEIETKCQSCHDHLEKSNQTKLCLDCHERIQKDINQQSGLHGHIEQQQKENCIICHSDHQGREFDITGLDPDNFNHSKTNFPLDGAHQTAACSNCHIDQKSSNNPNQSSYLTNLPKNEGYRFDSYQCSSCHIDYHEQKSKNECEFCHATTNWLMNEFDHDKTEFKLDGKHQMLQCTSCHFENQFKAIGTECQSCHLANDSHLGVFGEKCTDCHTAKGWEYNTYNHYKETGYKLVDSHYISKGKRTKCISCHSEKSTPDTKCIACHKADDVHQSGNGEACQDCHNQKSWGQTEFSHNFVTTGFELLGKHKMIGCQSCHMLSVKQSVVQLDVKLTRSCVDCHRIDDPHFEKLGAKCDDCHSEMGWTESVRFNHDFSIFPLTASHRLLVCESCHSSSNFSQESQKCFSCHQEEDPHNQALGIECDSCHNASTWRHWQFEHELQTKFPLNGAHQNLQCGLCHTNKTKSQVNKDCYSCHREDDVHQGEFGVECQRCHTESSFESLKF